MLSLKSIFSPKPFNLLRNVQGFTFANKHSIVTTTKTSANVTEIELNDEKPKRKSKTPKEITINQDIKRYFQSNHLDSILTTFPKKLLQKKHKSSDCFYVTHPEAAKLICDVISKESKQDVPIVEVNPGTGLLTEHLLQTKLNKLHLFEVNNEFIPILYEQFVSKYPGKITLTPGDFIGMWKLSYQDKFDNKRRLDELLSELPMAEWKNDINFKCFACVGSLNFFKYLISSIVGQNGLLSLGRCELYLAIPPPLYIHLTCNREAGYITYRSTSILFQIMFEHKFITKIPRNYFVPWQYEPKTDKRSKNAKINCIDPTFIYLIRIRPRQNIYQLCPPEYMQALWFFVKQNCISRKNRIIPNLEKWMPGAGPRLIINTEKSIPPGQLYIDDDAQKIPKYSTIATTMSTKDFFENINIFTEFGDLTPSQMFSVFDQFRNWPGYNQSPFLSLMESNLLKMETTPADQDQGITEEDDDDDVKK